MTELAEPLPLRPSRFDRRFAEAAAVALLTLVGIAMLLLIPRSRPAPRGVRPAAAPVIPEVEPAAVIPMAEDRARAINAAIPFAPGKVVPAASFRFRGSAADRERATACLAAAVWYEAGDDKAGQQAVAQVVINRARHPAFPASICGVVFQGSGLRTGCQFTFTCDGSLDRRPDADARDRARSVAAKALAGATFGRVGYATHYHTDWVVPYWSGSLDKIAAVGTHLFFRWRGDWGRPGAFDGRVDGSERLDPRILAFADTAKLPAEDLVASSGGKTPLVVPGAAGVRLSDLATGEFVLELIAVPDVTIYRKAAQSLCGDRAKCRVAGWTRLDRLPAKLPLPTAVQRSATFLYQRNRAAGIDAAFWNCRQLDGIDPARCVPGTAPAPDPAPTVIPPPLPASLPAS